jgi:hypothetical protein
MNNHKANKFMNKNTRQARRAGYASKKDQNNGGTKVFAGSNCDTCWDSPNSKKRRRKTYGGTGKN